MTETAVSPPRREPSPPAWWYTTPAGGSAHRLRPVDVADPGYRGTLCGRRLLAIGVTMSTTAARCTVCAAVAQVEGSDPR